MPKAAPRPCTKPGCGAYAVAGGRCRAHPHPAKWVADAKRGNRHQRGYGTYWEKLRIAILRRDNYSCRCPECAQAPMARVADEVDHIVPKARGGSDDPSNLQAINRDCHQRKTSREGKRRR